MKNETQRVRIIAGIILFGIILCGLGAIISGIMGSGLTTLFFFAGGLILWICAGYFIAAVKKQNWKKQPQQ